MANYDSKNLFQSQNLIWVKRKKKNAVSFLLKAVTFTPYWTAFVPSRKPYRVNFSFTFSDCARPPLGIKREFRQRRRRRQRERQKRNRFRQAKQQLCTCITLFCTFLCRRCTTTTWNCLISRFVEDGNKRQQLSFSFPELWCSPLEFNPQKICQDLTN